MSPRPPRSEGEVRSDLAAAYRLAALNGWDDTVYTHLSASVPGEPGHYLINRFGLLFDEVTASNLVKVDTAGRVVDGARADGVLPLGPAPTAGGTGEARPSERELPPVNPSGFAIHGAVHAARPEVECVIHLHSPWAVALCALPGGLQPTSQWAMRLHGRLGRHAYEGLALKPDEQRRMVAALGRLDGLLLEHHGPLVVGRTVAEAYMLMHVLERAAKAQLRVLAAAGGAGLGVPAALAERTYSQWVGDGSERDGDVEWPALLRRARRLSPGFEA